MEILDVICRIPTLRELKLAENDLQGDLSMVLSNLSALEVLEVQANKLSSIPGEIGSLPQLRILNVSDNHLRTIPQDIFASKSLLELQASKNRLEGSLFRGMSNSGLHELHVANNSLTSLADGDAFTFPAIRTLNLSTNRLISLPDVSSWTSLTSLLVGENKLKSLPKGFASLQQLRTADLTGNDITQLDDKIALMDGLEHLTIAANPLRERKFLSMNTEDIKRDLASRLQPADDPATADVDLDDEATGTIEHSLWQPNRHGMLDLSNKALDNLDESGLKVFADQIHQVHLQQNIFEAIPTTLTLLSHLTLLDLSKNGVETALSVPLELPKLRELRLSGNRIRSFEPLTAHLTAPSLQILDVSRNSLSGSLPILRSSFPELITLLASDNGLSDVSAEALTGLRIVNLSNNDIERLEPRIGLLQGTLTGFEVEGNKFRVPNWQVLRKGTDAVLTWLRDKIPRESWKSDATEFFDADDGVAF
jgi:Leucine-rich repeat (LRR) protein